MAYRKNQTNAQIVPLALAGIEGETATGNMSTNSYRVGHPRFAPYIGNLPKSWARLLGDRFHAGRISQVIYSYSTPIAWRDEDYGWIIPRVTYSVTTSARHQPHLHRLDGRNLAMPWDATPEDAQRVMDGLMLFVRAGKWGNGEWAGTRPGPNYVAGE